MIFGRCVILICKYRKDDKIIISIVLKGSKSLQILERLIVSKCR